MRRVPQRRFVTGFIITVCESPDVDRTSRIDHRAAHDGAVWAPRQLAQQSANGVQARDRSLDQVKAECTVVISDRAIRADQLDKSFAATSADYGNDIAVTARGTRLFPSGSPRRGNTYFDAACIPNSC